MAASEVIFEKTFANGWTKKLTKRLTHQKRRNTSLGPLIDPYITSPAGDRLRSSYELLNYVIDHPEYWYNIDVSEINLERVHPDQMKAPCCGTKKLREFLNYVRSGMSCHEAKEKIGGYLVGKHGRPEDSNSSIDVGHSKTPRPTKCPKTKKRKTKTIVADTSNQHLFGDFCQFPNGSTGISDSSLIDDSNIAITKDDFTFDPEVIAGIKNEIKSEIKAEVQDLKDSLMSENRKEFLIKLKDLVTSVIQYTDKEGRVVSRPFMKLPSRKELPKYYKIIKKPMDISKIWLKIEEGKYNDIPELESDFELLCKNAQKYNQEGSLIYQDSEILLTVFEEAKNKFVFEMLEDISFDMDSEPELETKDVEESEKLPKLPKRRGRPPKSSNMRSNRINKVKKKKTDKPLIYCKPCNHSTKIKANMLKHELSGRHKTNVEKPKMPTRIINTYPYSELSHIDPYCQVPNKIDPFLECFLQLDINSSATVGRVIDFSEF